MLPTAGVAVFLVALQLALDEIAPDCILGVVADIWGRELVSSAKCLTNALMMTISATIGDNRFER